MIRNRYTMSKVNTIFDNIEQLTQKDGQTEFIGAIITDLLKKDERVKPVNNEADTYQLLKTFLLKIIHSIDELSNEISADSSILISVKHQKLLRTCYQLITSIGISPCLIPGLGISLTKRCSSSTILPWLKFNDDQKYELLVTCTNFITRSYKVQVLKNVIVTLHLCDYLAALIQLAFAPLKKPGVYKDFTMSEEKYNQLQKDRILFVAIFEDLVRNFFQPTLMKELLVLQGINDPPPPAFVKRVITKVMSQRLLADGGLLSLIRCFIESYNIDSGFEWKKIDMICRIVSVKHGNVSEEEYLTNICSQLDKILQTNNSHYLVTAVACVLSLNEKYSECNQIKELLNQIFEVFHISALKSDLPGTVILSPKEVDHNVNILHACVCSAKLDWSIELLSPNIQILFLIGSKCTNNEDLKLKLKDILIKCLEKLNKNDIFLFMKDLIGNENSQLFIEEYDIGIAIKSPINSTSDDEGSKSDELTYFLNLFKMSTEVEFVRNVFEASLDILIDLSKKRKMANKDLMSFEEEPVLFDSIDAQYANVLQLLSEITISPKIVVALKNDPLIVFNFIEYFLSKENYELNTECTSIAIILLNTLLSNIIDIENLEQRFITIIPVLKELASNEDDFNHILCKEALSLITKGGSEKNVTDCSKAISDVFDNLLPVRAHGLIELTKLIDAKDPETISKRHYVFCLFQEQLKDKDSYIYLAAINGLAALCTHCTEDVLQVLCKEFLEMTSDHIQTDVENKVAEMKMKIGDVIVKVTRKLGEMAIVHKTTLLNTMLCACRDNDPLIRTSALSNLAEIVLVLHYKIGNIIYEVLLCIWSIIETDKAIECRRAAVMVISSLLKGLGKETLVQLKENLLPLYRTLKTLYHDSNEDAVLRLHAQIALEELNDIVREYLFPELKIEKEIRIDI